MGDKDDYLTTYRVFFENFAANVDPEDQLPVNIAGYTITEAELPGEVIYWTTQYLTEKQCPLTLMTPLQRIILDEVKVAAKQYPYDYGYDAEESEYFALRLMQAVTARVNDVCMRYLDNARLDTLPPPPPLDKRDYRTSSSVTKNSRRVMEDRHFEIGNLEALFGIETTEPTSFYGVYDGHAGSAAATYCAAHLHQYLVESPHFTKDLRRALHDAFLRTDAEFIRKSNQKRASGGSTAVVVCVRARRLVAAWAGDSLALLAKRMKLMQLVHPHKPDRPDERERIESTGGKVMYWGTWRVNGQLAVSRAIGDAQYKPYVTAQPEIAVVDLDGDEDFVVVACDGLWDFVSEDVVAFSVYKQLATDPNDLKAVTKNLLRQAKSEGSEDNISVIVVFLKDPRDIAADNCPPMELGLDNAVVSAPPFSVENDVRKVEAAGGGAGAENDISDSDSDDLGPETAVDIDADDVDDARHSEPAAPTPPAHAVEESQADGNLVDNVAESGEDSEDEWNYYKGEREREQNTGEEIDEAPRSETPGQDNSAWESSSVDMNSSPLNPDAPVFVPGGVAGSDMLLAESPRKPLPMDDIELPDVAQFQTEAHVRPAELHDLDNCDQLNGHHNLSMEGVTEHLNGNGKNTMDSLGFGFNVGIEDKAKDTSLIQDFERIQKDTTDFCNIQVFQAHETNPFSVEGNDELFERLKNKERDPMSMSFYQEKDDDTCERFTKPDSRVDLNAVQLLPESDDEDIPSNGDCRTFEDDKENFNPERKVTDMLGLGTDDEPNNDIIRHGDNGEVMGNNFVDFYVDPTNNMQNYSNSDFDCNLQQQTVAHTDTPESHKLLFEQIPEIPDGKSSELGFNNEDALDPSESDKDVRAVSPQDETSQDIEMDSKQDDLLSEDVSHSVHANNEIQQFEEIEQLSSEQFEDNQNEIVSDLANTEESNTEKAPLSPEPSDDHIETASPEVNHENVIVDVHHNSEVQQNELLYTETANAVPNMLQEQFSDVNVLCHENNEDALLQSESPLPRDSPLHQESISRIDSALQTQQLSDDIKVQAEPAESPLPTECLLQRESSPLRDSSPPRESSPLRDSSPPRESSPLRDSSPPRESSPLRDSSPPRESSPLRDSSPPRESSPLRDSSPTRESLLPCESDIPCESSPLREQSLPRESPLPCEPSSHDALQPSESPLLRDSPLPNEALLTNEGLTHGSPLPAESPLPIESKMSQVSDVALEKDLSGTKSPQFDHLEHNMEPTAPIESPIPCESDIKFEALPKEESSREPSPMPAEIPLPRESPIPSDSPAPEESQMCDKDGNVSHEKDESLVNLVENVKTEDILEQTQKEAEIEKDFDKHKEEISLDVTKEDFIQNSLHIENLNSQAEVPKESITSESIEISGPSVSLSPVQDGITSQVVELVASPIPTVASPITAVAEQADEPTPIEPSTDGQAPTPDIVPESRNRTELVTDIDIGIPESHAQEICVPVSSEIVQEEAIPAGTTPPPTPAAPPAAEPVQTLGDAPIAAALAAGATVAAVGATIAKAKSASPKKSSTAAPSKSATPKSTTKLGASASSKTPTSATKRPVGSATPKSPAPGAARPAAPRTPVSANKSTTPAKLAAKTTAPLKSTTSTVPAAKTAPKPAPTAAAPRSAAPTRPAAPRPVPKAPAPKAAPTAPKLTAPAGPKPAAPAAKPTAPPRAVPRTAPARAPLSSAPTKPKEVKPKAPEPKKPLTNGDVKASAKPALTRAPAPRTAAPRPTPRAPAAAPAATKPAAPKPPVRAPLDKQSKDLANKRITAKAAPPRTAPIKAPASAKSVPKPLTKKSVEKKPALNGDAPHKPPPSPPAADNALLPDVIA